MLEEIIFPIESLLVALARWDWANVSLGAMNLAFVAFKTAFVAKAFAVTGCVGADVWAGMLVFVSPIAM